MAEMYTIDGGKTGNQDTQKIPVNDYAVITMSGQEFYATGFCIFTSHHIAIMRDDGDGAVPVLVVPLNNVAAVELVEDDEIQDELL